MDDIENAGERSGNEGRTPKSRMPAGKMQFGIIVPTEIHTRAKHIAADLGLRISDVYAQGVQKLGEEYGADPNSAKRASLGRSITEGVPEEQWKYFEALRSFLRSQPDAYKLRMLDAVLDDSFPRPA